MKSSKTNKLSIKVESVEPAKLEINRTVSNTIVTLTAMLRKFYKLVRSENLTVDCSSTDANSDDISRLYYPCTSQLKEFQTILSSLKCKYSLIGKLDGGAVVRVYINNSRNTELLKQISEIELTY